MSMVKATFDLAGVKAALARAKTTLKDRELAEQDLLASVAPMVEDARDRAPKRTGKGAASIHAEPDEPQGDEIARVIIGPTKKHWYLKFAEIGTRFMAAHPFLRPAQDAKLGVVTAAFAARVVKRFNEALQ